MNRITLSTALICTSMTFMAQIKVWSGANTPTVIGSTSATSTVGHELQVIGKSIFTSGTGTVSSAPYIMGTNSYSSAGSPDYTWKNDSTTGIFHSNYGNVSIACNGAERMRVSTTANVSYFYGTGVYFPSSASTFTSCASIRCNSTYSSPGINDYSWYNDPDCGIFHPTTDVIGFATNAAERMRLTANGLLLGASADPGNVKLYVVPPANNQALYSITSFSTDYGYHQINYVNRGLTKAIAVQLSGTDNFLVYGSGDVWAKSAIWWSDRSLKENIDTLKGALSRVLKLQGVTYNFKPKVSGEATPKKEMGLIAQDVEAILPEVVRTNDNGLKGIAYQNLIALIIEAIKEQDKKITKLQSDLNACCNKSGNRVQQNNGLNTNGADNTGGQLADLGAAKLWQNVPNPFNQTTAIKCFIPEAGKTASILVFDLTGALKKTVPISGKGEVTVTIHAGELVAGMYHYSLIVDGQEIDTKKMILTE